LIKSRDLRKVGTAWGYALTLLFLLLTNTAWGVPTVTSTTPTAGATNVAGTATVTATFSEAMDPATVTNGSFTLTGIVGIKAVAAGGTHTVALKNDGTVVAWGHNGSGKTAVPAGLAGVTAVAAGQSLTVALKNDGTVVAWGDNFFGQKNVPAGLAGVTAVAAGQYHTVALKNDGTVVAWGYNAYGQTSVPAGLTSVTAIAAGTSHTVALKNDGTVVAWGSNEYGQTSVPAGLTGVTAIEAGAFYTVALKNDGTVVAWGNNSSGQTTAPAGLAGVTAIAAGSSHTVALKNDGTVVAWGNDTFGQTTAPAGLAGVTAIAAGSSHTVALKNDGTVVAWGSNDYGQTSVPAGVAGVTAVAAGGNHTVALKSGGTVVAWGYNGYGQATVPAGLAGVTAVAAGGNHTVALNNDGTVVAWGYNGYGQATVPAGLSGVTAVAAGSSHTVALKNDGTVVAWGYNDSGQTAVPAGLAGVTAVAAGQYHTVALKNDGTVVAWGRNGESQTTVPAAGLAGVTAIAAGGNHTVALKNDGTVVAWGYNGSGQTTAPAGLTGVTAIAAGESHTVALKNDGTVVAWGYNGSGQTAVPAGLAGVTTIATGFAHTVALKKDGSIAAWGGNNYGQSTVPVSPYENNLTGTVTYKNESNTATFTPASSLPLGSTVKATVNTGVRSLSGSHPATDHVWTFNVPPPIPTISGTPATNVTTSNAYNFIPTATFAENFSIVNKPSWANFNTATGALTGTPSTANVGSYSNIVIIATNSTGTVSLPAFSITVSAPPLPAISGAPETIVIVGTVYSFIPIATNAISFSISNKPTWATFNSTTGALTGTPASGNVGTYSNIVISAMNVTGSASLPAFAITVAKATPTITTWPTASGIILGQALSASNLAGGAASVPGSFAFTYPSTVPATIGNNSVSITFTPTDNAKYNSVSGSVTVAIAKGTPTITALPTASGITLGQALSASTLTGGTASVPGIFTFTYPATVSPVAGYYSASITFTPADNANYNSVSGNVVVVAVLIRLDVTSSGTGSGTITSAPAGIACIVGSSSDCSGSFLDGQNLSLYATPDHDSTFGGWTGACQGIADCSLSLTSNSTVNASFLAAPRAKILDTPYDTLGSALIAATTGATILARETEFPENVVFSKAGAIHLKGGYDAVFSSNSGNYTVIKGNLKIRSGRLDVQGVRLQ